MGSGMIYVASPYSSNDPGTMDERAHKAAEFCACLMRNGIHVFSPIVHCHPMAKHFDMPSGYEFYKEYDQEMIGLCESMIVLTLSGYELSHGIQSEVQYARKLGKPTVYTPNAQKYFKFHYPELVS